MAVARSEVAAARAALDQARDKAVEEVTRAYDQLHTSSAPSCRRRTRAASVLTSAAELAFALGAAARK